MSRAGDIYEFFKRFAGSHDLTDARTFVRSRLSLQFGDACPVPVSLRDVRERCCLLDVDEGIYTLAFADVLDIAPPTVTELAVVKVRVGALPYGRAAPSAPVGEAARGAREADPRLVRGRRHAPAAARVVEGGALPALAGRLFTAEEIVAELARPAPAGD